MFQHNNLRDSLFEIGIGGRDSLFNGYRGPE